MHLDLRTGVALWMNDKPIRILYRVCTIAINEEHGITYKEQVTTYLVYTKYTWYIMAIIAI